MGAPSGRVSGRPFGFTANSNAPLLKRHHGYSVVNTLFQYDKAPTHNE